MSKYKLSAKEIRDRVKYIVDEVYIGDEPEEIIKLIEEAVGEKLPDDIDRYVRHGAVWSLGAEKIVVIEGYSGWSSLYVGTFLQSGSPAKKKTELVQELRNDSRGPRYLGQYNFAAGLPAA